MASRNSYIHGIVDGHPNYSNFQPRKPLLNVLPSNDPLLQSPLYFQSGESSAAPPTRRSPLSSFGRLHVSHSHWMPDSDHSNRRSLPPDFNYRSHQKSEYRDNQSHHSNISPRRRSLPPNIGTPQQRHPNIHSLTTRSPPLWTVSEEHQNGHEPMDISPVKPPRPPSYSAASLSESSFDFASIDSVLPPPVKRETLPPTKSVLYAQGDKGGTVHRPSGIRKLANKGSQKGPQKGPHSIKEFSVCRFVVLTMIFHIAIGAGALIASMIGFDMVHFWCQHHQNLNTTLLSESFQDQVFGQHIAVDMIPKAIESYLEYNSSSSKKPLVMSFHGWTGVGKNHMSFIIGEHLRSGTTNKIICPHHFPHRDENYINNLRSMILPKFSYCTLNLFIIDEIDKAPENVIQGLYDILTMIRSPEYDIHLDHAKVVILMLSNTGATEINRKVFEARYYEKRDRESITYEELHTVFFDKENLDTEHFSWFKRLHEGGLIDTVVPFLPMEKEHVRMCIKKDMVDKGIEPTENSVYGVLDQMAFFPEVPLFSKWGCRKVPAKVDLSGN